MQYTVEIMEARTDQEAQTSPRVIGVKLPPTVSTLINERLAAYRNVVSDIIPDSRRYVSLFSLLQTQYLTDPPAALYEDLLQSFIPTITFTHIGAGERSNQLWAYVHRTPALNLIYRALHQRLITNTVPDTNTSSVFVNTPYVELAQINPKATLVRVPDQPLITSFSFKVVWVLRSGEHRGLSYPEEEGSITLTV